MNILLLYILITQFNILVIISHLTIANHTTKMDRKRILFNNSSVNSSHKRKSLSNYEFIRTSDINDLNLLITRKAFAGGVDIDGQTLFVCRVRVSGELIPGKYSKHLNKCAVTYNNKELQYKKYQLLIESKSGSYNWSQVRPPAKHLPPNIVLGGIGSDGQFYYICQCRLQTQHIRFISEQIGKVQFNQSIQQWMATVPFSGQEIQCLDYSVLIMKDKTDKQ